jgi:hypothetical protein
MIHESQLCRLFVCAEAIECDLGHDSELLHHHFDNFVCKRQSLSTLPAGQFLAGMLGVDMVLFLIILPCCCSCSQPYGTLNMLAPSTLQAAPTEFLNLLPLRYACPFSGVMANPTNGAVYACCYSSTCRHVISGF